MHKKLHPRNKHNGQYNFPQLIKACPDLATFVRPNPYGDLSIDFFNPHAVLMLNRALLKHFYGITHWDIPKHYLCPPIPGRADYIHHMADLLASSNKGIIPRGNQIKCLDIGVGANCIYPIIANCEYGWACVGADIDLTAVKSAKKIISSNTHLKGKVEIRLQGNPKHIFQGIIQVNELIDLSICNPPFHASEAEANAGTLRKLNNLTGRKSSQAILNFGGKKNELWCDGGEKKFIRNMITQSQQFANSCFWFSTLVSKQANLNDIYQTLKQTAATEVKTIPMGQGNKVSRLVAWTFLTPDQQQAWRARRWHAIENNQLGLK